MTGIPRTASVAAVVLSLFEFSLGQEDQSIPDVASVKELVQTVYEEVGPAVVRFGYGNERKLQFGSGVIVSADGLIAVSGPVHSVIEDELLDLRLVDGRRVHGKALGWSSEFGFGMLKITDAGPWPHVEIRERGDVKAGEFCVALAFPRESLPSATDGRLGVFSGVITQSAAGQWLRSSHRLGAGAYALVDLDGKLVGLNNRTILGEDPVHSNAALLKTHWEDLLVGKNIDRKRLYPQEPKRAHETEQQQPTVSESGGFAATVLDKAKAASVRISEVSKDKGLASGVIVTSDGHVITCGHHDRLPGHRVKLSLFDGRDANGVVLGNNRATDVGLVKITDEGPWPHAELGHSATMRPEDRCVVVGYPNARPGRDPWVRETRIIQSTMALPRKDDWYCGFLTQGFPHELMGASGGGVFDQRGTVIGVLLGGKAMGTEEEGEMNHVRVEVFREQWKQLAAATPVDVVDPEFLSKRIPICERIDEEMLADGKE